MGLQRDVEAIVDQKVEDMEHRLEGRLHGDLLAALKEVVDYLGIESVHLTRIMRERRAPAQKVESPARK